jgi:hypothetical protein
LPVPWRAPSLAGGALVLLAMKPKKHRTDFDHRRFASLAPLAREIPDIDSAISLLMISYTTRFLHLAHLARSLHAINPGAPEPTVLEQIENIRKRILLIRHMRATGISSLLLCVICMCLLFEGQVQIGSNLIYSQLGSNECFPPLVIRRNLDFGRCAQRSPSWYCRGKRILVRS